MVTSSVLVSAIVGAVAGYVACQRLIEDQGSELGFEPRHVPVAEMLQATPDDHIRRRAAEIEAVYQDIVQQGL